MNATTFYQDLEELGDLVIKMPGEEVQTDWITTGSMRVDAAFGGGFPVGYQTELFGPEGGGKSTLALQACVEAIGRGQKAIYIDVENKTPPEYPEEMGIPTERFVMARTESLNDAKKLLDTVFAQDGGMFVLLRPYNGPQALDLMKYALRLDNPPILIVLDSVSALQTSAEMDAKAGDHHVGIQARMMSQNLKVLKGLVGIGKTALVWINQIRMKIGVMYGNPETTSGGVALKFYTSIRARVSRTGWLTEDKERVGIECGVRTYKNALSSPRPEATTAIRWGKGIDKYADALEYGKQIGTVTCGGGYFKIMGEIPLYEGTDRGQDAAIRTLREHPEYLEIIRTGVMDIKEGECQTEDE